MESGKITGRNRSPLPSERRRYDDACGAAHGLDLVGDRWALLVVRELMFGPRRFGELRGGLPGVSANVLAQRLAELEAAGIVERRPRPSPGAYALTPWGAEIEPVFQALGRWAARSPAHDPTKPLSAASLLLSFRTMLDARRARALSGALRLEADGEAYRVRLADGALSAEREAGGPPAGPGPDATLRGAPTAVAAFVYGGAPLVALEAGGALAADGSRAWLERFRALFALPPKAEPRAAPPGEPAAATPRRGRAKATPAQAVDNSA